MKLVFNPKVVVIFCILFIIIFTLLYYISSFDEGKPTHLIKKPSKNPKKFLKNVYFEEQVMLPEKIVHLDLKGAPPKMSYFPKLFPLFKKLGATGILIEYEDMFPYYEPLQNISALNAYTIDNIKTINSLAENNGLKVIPFIQMFGHLDFLLKLEKYAEYREVWSLPSTICPSYNKTLDLLKELIQQVLNTHPNSNMVHIGCDDVTHLGFCKRCTNRMFTDQLTKNQLFLEHIRTIVGIIKKKNPAMEILIWDDHFRTLELEDIKKDPSLMTSFKPVVWWYGKDVYDELGPSLWNMYSNGFPRVWVASSFKGVIGSNKYVSDVNYYIQNQKSWLSVIREYHKKLHFDGIILTGWQRYDHFAVLCELLPVGIPSLAMSLRLLQGFRDSALGPPLEIAKILQCEQPYGLMGSAFGTPKCTFPGGDILENIINFHQLQQEFDEILDDSRVKRWLSEYNKAYSFSNPQQVKAVLMPLNKIKEELESIKTKLSGSMLEVYDNCTVQEWLDTYLSPFETKVGSMLQVKQRILEKEYWPRRPLNFNKEM